MVGESQQQASFCTVTALEAPNRNNYPVAAVMGLIASYRQPLISSGQVRLWAVGGDLPTFSSYITNIKCKLTSQTGRVLLSFRASNRNCQRSTGTDDSLQVPSRFLADYTTYSSILICTVRITVLTLILKTFRVAVWLLCLSCLTLSNIEVQPN